MSAKLFLCALQLCLHLENTCPVALTLSFLAVNMRQIYDNSDSHNFYSEGGSRMENFLK